MHIKNALKKRAVCLLFFIFFCKKWYKNYRQ
ncbi:hypothetical protein IM043_gp079 [Bacillus phage SPG24]|nr:hypothetical protein IM043_gp079 [Bacillus phage SPG24]